VAKLSGDGGAVHESVTTKYSIFPQQRDGDEQGRPIRRRQVIPDEVIPDEVREQVNPNPVMCGRAF
jgi:hypothetical protein